MTELINRHGETCKQVIIIKRIKKRTNQKASTITFLKKKSNFDHETGRERRLNLSNS